MLRRRDDRDGKAAARTAGPREIDPAVIVARVRASFTSPSYRPPLLPAVAVEVHELAVRRDVDLGRVIAVLEKDALLAARIIKLSRSAASAPATTIQSLRDAVMRVGLRNVADAAWEVALEARLFRAPRYEVAMEVVRRHSTASAYLARLVAGFTSVATDYAFLCGLLHDVGMAAALAMLAEGEGEPLPDAVIAHVLTACHEEASGVVASLWRLPADIQLVLANHHEVVVSSFVHPLIAIVAIAEQLARHLDLGIIVAAENCDPTPGNALRQARTALHLEDRHMDALRTQAEALVRSIPSLAARGA